MTPLPIIPLLRPLFWTVGVHGITDAWTCTRAIPAYALALVDWPCTTPLFFAASAVHLSHDVGPFGSLILHAFMGTLALCRMDVAYTAMLAFMIGTHVPNHYARVYETLKHHPRSVTRCAMCTVVATLVAAAFAPAAASVNDVMQRIVCVHVGIDQLVWRGVK